VGRGRDGALLARSHALGRRLAGGWQEVGALLITDVAALNTDAAREWKRGVWGPPKALAQVLGGQ
jgi:hypothetical protein